MERSGAAHIEVIIAFVMFMGFLLIVFYFFNPLGNTSVVNSQLPFLYKSLLSKINVPIETYSIKITDARLGEDDLIIEVGEINGGDFNVRVENYYSEMVFPSIIENGKVKFSPEGEDFVFLKLSEGFAPSVNSPMGDISRDYQISYVGKRKIVSEKRVKELNESYHKNYSSIKSEFNLENANFDYRLVLNDVVYKGGRFIPVGIDVFSEYKRVEVLRKSGKSEFADMILRVW